MNDIGKLLAQAVHLPLHSQKTLLKEIGNAYAKRGEGRCNIFGGSESCEPIPKDSDYAKICANANEKVDCAFKMTALEHVSKDPETHFQNQLAVEGNVYTTNRVLLGVKFSELAEMLTFGKFDYMTWLTLYE
jgi:hypothetical protein